MIRREQANKENFFSFSTIVIDLKSKNRRKEENKVNKLKTMLVLGIFLLSNLGSFISTIAYAEEGRDVTSNVTSLTVSPTSVRDGEKFTVNLKFDEKTMDIQSGDYINVSWPRNDDIFGSGFNKSIDLLIQGKNVGKLNVTTDGAVIIFNDNIRNLDDVEGWAQFEVQARNLTNTPEENTGDLTVISGDKRAVVSVTKPASGTGPGVFYYKTGDMLPEDTDHVRWFLNINNNKAYVEQDVRILDEIQPGQTLDPSSFEIITDSPNGEKVFRGEEGITNFLAAYPGANFYYSVDENKITINLPENITNLTSFNVSYKTIITNASQEYFDNHSKAWFKEYNQPAVTGEEFNHSVENIDVSGGVNGTVKGELKIVKNVQETEVGIPHVQFELKRADGDLIQGQESVVLETDEQGVTGIKKLAVGDYIVKEVHAPDWIDFDPLATKELKFTMTDQDTSGVALNVSNEKKKISITANKVWEGGETPRPTVYFKLYRVTGNGNQPEEVPNVRLGEMKDGNLSFTWNELEQYDDYGNEYQFSVKEVDENGNDFVPNGYTKSENGLTVINKSIEKTNIQGTKRWDDQDNQDGKRPESIKVNLLANGHVVATKEVSAADDWKYQFENLPKYENGQAINYTVTEDQVADYSTKITGYDITNSYTPGKTSVSVTKAWDDHDNQDGLRPNSIKVQLYANDKAEGEAVELTAGTQWHHTWTDLAEKAKGQTIQYTVKEVSDIPGYTSKVDNSNLGNVTITNAHTPEVTQVNGTKRWDDQDNQDGKRPESIKVNLLANGHVVATKEVSAADDWKYQFENLPKYENGQAINYTVTEDQVADYSTKITGYDITNSYTPGKTSVSVTKAWDDHDNQDGLRPNSIKVQLYANDKAEGEAVELTAGTQWRHTWTDLAEKAKGQTIQYTVKEISEVPGYSSEVDDRNLGNVTITNTHTPEVTQINGTKTWNDSDNQDGKRPGSIKVNLLANGHVVATKEVSATDGWKYQFENLPKYENGQAINYTVTEDQVPDYNTAINRFDITNSYTPGKTSVSVTKAWNDSDNQDGLRPNSVTVQLYANGEKVGKAIELNKTNNWTTTWSELPEKANGQAIKYTVKEVSDVPGYTSEVDDSNLGNVIITNTHTPEVTKVSGTKTWDDHDNQDGKRPKKIKVNLLANGNVVATKEVSATDGWKYQFENLPKYENGQAIDYTVTEDQVIDYSTEINGYDITNSYTPGKTSVSVTKAWDDQDNQDGLRPNSIKVQLYANGKAEGEAVELSAGNQWRHTWTDLAEKTKGQAITYTVKEVTTVKGYTAVIDDTNSGNIVITNVHTPQSPQEPKTDASHNNNNNNTNNKPTADSNKAQRIPKTGSKDSMFLTVLGVLVIGSLGLIIKKRS